MSDNEENNPDSDGATESLEQLQDRLLRLSEQQGKAMEAIATLSNRSYVYVPRERQIQPFCGDTDKDGRSVDEFIEEVDRVIRARGQSAIDGVDYTLSLLRGSALEEVKLCIEGEPQTPTEIFNCLREAYSDKRSVAQLLHAFYGRQQQDGEDFQHYSHSLSQILRQALKQKPNAVSDAKLAVRDQFIEGVFDTSLRRELRRLVREKPGSTLKDIRELAIAWSLEEKPCNSRVAKSRTVTCENPANEGLCASISKERSCATLEDVIRAVSEQSKAIGELTIALKEGLMKRDNVNKSYPQKTKSKPQFTNDGKPICFKCRGEGHIAKDCTQSKPNQTPSTQEN